MISLTVFAVIMGHFVMFLVDECFLRMLPLGAIEIHDSPGKARIKRPPPHPLNAPREDLVSKRSKLLLHSSMR